MRAKRKSPELKDMPRWLVLNKVDLLPAETREKTVNAFVRKLGWKGRTFVISALNGEGCQKLTFEIMDHLDRERSANPG